MCDEVVPSPSAGDRPRVVKPYDSLTVPTLELLGEAVTKQVREIRGTQRSQTVELQVGARWGTYYQFASYDGDAVLIEVPGASVWPAGLSPFDEEWLAALGFTAPGPGLPNWWIGMEDGRDEDLSRAARATVRALLEVYGAVDLPEVIGVELPRATTTAACDDNVLYEALRLTPELNVTKCETHRVSAEVAGTDHWVEFSCTGTMVRVSYYGPMDLEGSFDDSEWGLWYAARAHGAQFTMFPDPAAIAHRLRFAFWLQCHRGADNPFRRRIRS